MGKIFHAFLTFPRTVFYVFCFAVFLFFTIKRVEFIALDFLSSALRRVVLCSLTIAKLIIIKLMSLSAVFVFCSLEIRTFMDF